MDATEITATLKGVPDDFLEARQILRTRYIQLGRV
jgi:hypothetical protein